MWRCLEVPKDFPVILLEKWWWCGVEPSGKVSELWEGSVVWKENKENKIRTIGMAGQPREWDILWICGGELRGQVGLMCGSIWPFFLNLGCYKSSLNWVFVSLMTLDKVFICFRDLVNETLAI